MNKIKAGILGGGQLGRMLIQEALNYNIEIHVLDPSADAPCSKIAHNFVQGDFADHDTVMQFGQNLDILTIEIEHVSESALKELKALGKKVYPDPEIIRIIKDKGEQKKFYQKRQIPTAEFQLIENRSGFNEIGLKPPFVQKLRSGGYDGRGVTVLNNETDVLNKSFDAPSVIEKKVEIAKELSVIVARNENSEVEVFPVIEMVFDPNANLVDYLFSPADISEKQETEAYSLAVQVAEAFELNGLLAIEMFLDNNGKLYVNECAPRPHNSGHHTIEANYTSQYGQLLRIVMGMPLGNSEAHHKALMINLLGEPAHDGKVKYEGMNEVLKEKGIYVHLYGKTHTRPYRKMGHVTILGEDLENILKKVNFVKNKLKVIT